MSNCFLLQSKPYLAFTSDELLRFNELLLRNCDVLGMGCDAAGTSSDIDYFYHWNRDASASLYGMQRFFPFATYEPYLKGFTQFILNMQTQSDKNGVDIRGEPKFCLPDGKVFTGPWARPQNDGTSFSIITLCSFAQTLTTKGQVDYVNKYLWNKTNGAINVQLDYECDNYNNFTYDLWEEISNTNFFWNKVITRCALVYAVAVAQSYNETALVLKYKKIINELEKQISKFWNGYAYTEANNRLYDASVLMAIQIDSTLQEPFFNISSYKVAATILTLSKLFSKMFSINTQDTKNLVPGILIGRYEGDTYKGGNPWINITGSLAVIYYRAANAIYAKGLPDLRTIEKWKKCVNYVGEIITKEQMAILLVRAGDSILSRLKYHTQGNNGNLFEQIDKNTGFMISCENLTVAYATIITAIRVRQAINYVPTTL
jgi:glucoamylase